MANPFEVEVANPLQALLIGQKAYSDASEARKQQGISDARAKAVQAYQTGDPKAALATLLGVGDVQGANAIGTQIQNDWTRKHTETQDARQAGRDSVADQHWQASFGLQKRAADRADDPTPSGFVKQTNGTYAPLPGGPQDPAYMENVAAAKARAAGLVAPDGFTRAQDGSLAPIPGGPQDPAYLASRTKAEAAAKGDTPQIIGPGSSIIVPNKAADGPVFTNKVAGGGLSNDALDIRAAQWNNGDYEGATKNVGRGAQGGATLEAISNRAAQRLIEQGMNPEQAAALTSQNMQKFRASGIGQNTEARTGASREANLNLILKATEAAIPAALEQSEKVSRTGWVPLNKIIQGGQVMTSDPELRKFGMANLQLAEHWARAMNPTGVMREADRDLALHFLSTADSKDTYKQAVGQLKTQITRERDAIKGGATTDPAAAGLKAKYGLD
jgi:hypothetical protein